jgi:hypothetical protein
MPRPQVKYFNNFYYIYFDIADSSDRRIITQNGILSTIDIDDKTHSHYQAIELRHVDKDPDDHVLIDYLSQFRRWIYSAKLNNIYSIDFTVGEVLAVRTTFFRLLEHYQQNKKITSVEYTWFEKCANNALCYLKQDNITAECTSYDRKMCYANILGSDLMIPTKPGNEFTLDSLPKRKQLLNGFYHVKIIAKNLDFHKCFTFSKHNVYVDNSLKFAMKYKKKFKLKFELIMDGKPNAYLYNEDDMVPLKTMTYKWHEKITKLKTTYKNNPLIKFVASSTWGCIQQRCTKWYSLEQIEKKQLDVGMPGGDAKYKIINRKFKKDTEYYEIVNTYKAYHFNLRVKPWVTAQARNDLGSLARKHLKHIVRIQTDSISFDKEIDINDTNYATEDKTTGLIHWDNVNSYHNKTNGYKSKTYKL